MRGRGRYRKVRETERLHLTDRRLEALPIPEKDRTVYDAKSSLGVRLKASGKRIFFWFRSVRGTPVWKTVGQWPLVSLSVARDKAREFDGELARWKKEGFKGASPFERRMEKLTLGELSELYAEHVLLQAANRERGERAAKSVRATLSNYVADWKRRELSEITRADIYARHAKLWKTKGGTTANRTIDLVRRLYRWAADRDLFRGESPARMRVRDRYKEPQRTRYLSPEELARFLDACEKTPNRDLADFVLLSLATGQRKKTVMRARWAAIDLGRGTWSLSATETKNAQPHTVELSPRAIRVLRERLANQPETPWVFPGIDPQHVRFGFNESGWRRLLKDAGLDYPRTHQKNFRGHDLRHTYVSYQVMSGRSLEMAGKAVGHASIRSTERYAHLSQETQRQTVEAGEAAIERAIEEVRKKRPLVLAERVG